MNSSRCLPVGLVLCLFSLCLSPALAAKGEGRQNRPLESLQYCLKQLDLTADQQTKVDDILADAQTKAAAIRKSAKGSADKDKDALREKVKALIQDIHTQLQKVLTPEQSEKLKKLMEKEREERKEDSTDHKGHHPATTEPAP